jgi:hypothetical protein
MARLSAFARTLRNIFPRIDNRRPQPRRLGLVSFEDRLAPAGTPVGFAVATPIDTPRAVSIVRNPADGDIVTHFKVSAIANGKLFEDAALTKQIADDTFVSLSDGAGGVFSSTTFYFSPTAGFTGTMTFDVQASEDAAGTGISTAYGATVAVLEAGTPYIPADAGLYPDVGSFSLNATKYDFVVQYKDAVGIDVTSLGAGDVVVTNRAGTYTGNATFVGATTGPTVYATYRIVPPGGDWDAADKGDFVIALKANEVLNTGGKAVVAQDISGFSVDVTPPDANAMQVQAINVAPIDDAGKGLTSHSFIVTYSDGAAVDVATLDGTNIAVVGPGGYFFGSTFVTVDDKTNGTPRNATYSLSAPAAGGWSKDDNGVYTIVSMGTAKNAAGTAVASGVLGTFTVTIGAAAPTANFTATASTVGEDAGTVTLTVELDQPAAADTFVQIAFTGTATLNDPATNPADFDYTVTDFNVAPFTVQIAAGQTTGTMKVDVRDDTVVEASETAIFTIDPASAGITVGTKNAFTLSITDNDKAAGGAPTAAIGNAPPIDAAFENTTKYDFEVVFTANAAGALIDATSIDDGNVRITGPGGFTQNAVFVSATPFPGNQSPLTVVYRLTPPGGTWDKSDNGDYVIEIVGNQVKDSAGTFVAAGTLKTVTATLTNTAAGGAMGPVVLGYPGFGVGQDKGGQGKVTINTTSLGATTVVDTLTPFPGFTGSIRTAAADFNGDGFTDLIAATGPGRATQIRIFDGADRSKVLFELAPFEPAFQGGIFVTTGDLTGDGTPDFAISPDEGGGPRVRVFNGKSFTQIADFFGIDDPNFRGGARAAMSDLSGDGKADLLVAAGFGGGPRLAIYNGATLTSTGGPKFVGDFFVFEQTLRNGVFLSAGDVNGDGFADIMVGGGPGGGPRIFGLSGKDITTTGAQTQVANFFAGDTSLRGGIRITMKDADGDNFSDIIVGSGTGAGSTVIGYAGKNVAANGTPTEMFNFPAYPGFTGGVFVG